MSGVVSVNLFHLMWVLTVLTLFAAMNITCGWLVIANWKKSKFNSLMAVGLWVASTIMLRQGIQDFWPLAFPVT